MFTVQIIEFRLINFLKPLVEGKLRLTSHFTFNDSFQACNKSLTCLIDSTDRTLSELEKRNIFELIEGKIRLTSQN